MCACDSMLVLVTTFFALRLGIAGILTFSTVCATFFSEAYPKINSVCKPALVAQIAVYHFCRIQSVHYNTGRYPVKISGRSVLRATIFDADLYIQCLQ